MEQICIYKPLCTALLPKMRPMSQNPMFLVPYVTLAATFGVFRLTRLFGPLDTQWFQFGLILSSYSLVGNSSRTDAAWPDQIARRSARQQQSGGASSYGGAWSGHP